MSVTPTEILEAAKGFAKGNSEVDWRNAVSRAYYAAYHRSMLIVEGLGVAIEGGGVHRMLVDTLTENRNSNIKAVGYMLEECRRYRVRADYRIGEEFPFSVCQTVLEQAGRILARADKIE